MNIASGQKGQIGVNSQVLLLLQLAFTMGVQGQVPGIIPQSGINSWEGISASSPLPFVSSIPFNAVDNTSEPVSEATVAPPVQPITNVWGTPPAAVESTTQTGIPPKQDINDTTPTAPSDVNDAPLTTTAPQDVVAIPPANLTRECIIQENSNAEGSLLDQTIATDVGDCCAQCGEMLGCNTFVYCPNPEGCDNLLSVEDPKLPFQQCDLKQQLTISLGANPMYYYRGEETDFVSGFIEEEIVGAGLSPDTCAVYKTDGPSQLAVDEGAKIMAPNGDDFLRVNTALECVTACEAVTRKCNQPCCDSVTFNPDEGKCFLKVKGVKGKTQTNDWGWQSFWRFEEGEVGADVSAIGSITICPEQVQHMEYADAYITLGVGQIALSEGRILEMEDGSYTKRFTTLVECALECQKLIECDALTYSAESFTCLLRSGSQKFSTISSQHGETTYWRLSETLAEQQCNKKGWYCLYCGGDYGDTCEYY